MSFSLTALFYGNFILNYNLTLPLSADTFHRTLKFFVVPSCILGITFITSLPYRQILLLAFYVKINCFTFTTVTEIVFG